MEPIKDFIIFIVGKKSSIDSSYFFHKLFTSMGYFGPVESIVEELTQAGYLRHEGYFNGTSGLIQKISLTQGGSKKYDQINIEAMIEKIEATVGKSNILSQMKSAV